MKSDMISKDDIARLIPHSGAMCLLDRVDSWDETAIACTATSHRDPGNPMAARGLLPGLAGVEYAAQAMAAHGALTAATNGRPRAGYLASLRDLDCGAARLDDLPGDLRIAARLLMGGGSQVIYEFTVSHAAHDLLNGRAAVVLEVIEA